MKSRNGKRLTDRLCYYTGKLEQYGGRLRADRNYDANYMRRSRLMSYRNRTFKLLNLEKVRELRKARREGRY